MTAFLVALCIFLSVAAVSINVAFGRRKIAELRDVPFDACAAASAQPKVSIVVSACNEAATIELAIRSLLKLTYKNLEIIVIDDRSTDATPEILDRLGLANPLLQVLHITSLPSDWLGKNHALALGAELAQGEYLLFTDADAVFAPTAVSRAVAYCQAYRVDHLALLFDVVAPTPLLQMMITSFVTGVMAKFQPWKVNRSARHFIGIGGFNMVRSAAYRQAGGHRAIPMAVLDDLMLGQLIKTSGHVQHVLLGTAMVTIEWYPDTAALFRGLEKNIFAAFDYRLPYLAAATAVYTLTRIWPWLALFVVQGMLWWLYAATVLVTVALTADLLHARRWRLRNLLFAPLVPLLELAMWWRGCWLTYRWGGIKWRGTFYPLAKLRHAHQNYLASIRRIASEVARAVDDR